MPNCFILTPVGSKEPEKLQTIDDKMREHFGADPDPEHWYCNWYNWVGLLLACGKDWNGIREIYPEPHYGVIIDYLEANYTSDAWAEIGRR